MILNQPVFLITKYLEHLKIDYNKFEEIVKNLGNYTGLYKFKKIIANKFS